MNKVKFYKVISVWEFLVFSFLFLFSLFLLLFYLKGMVSSFTYKGIKSLHKKDLIQAQKHFTQALTKRPFDPWSYMNLALSHDLLNIPDKALETYNIVSSHLVKQSNWAVFYSHFNKGELNGRLGQLEKALENYQKALEFKYKEKEIKKNIELLFQNNQNSEKNKEGKQGENQSENKQDQENKAQQDNEGDSTNREKPSTEKNKQSQSGNKKSKPGGKNQEEKDSKGLSEKEQKAILEEIEKQENKVRSRFYQRKSIFGDKTTKDW